MKSKNVIEEFKRIRQMCLDFNNLKVKQISKNSDKLSDVYDTLADALIEIIINTMELTDAYPEFKYELQSLLLHKLKEIKLDKFTQKLSERKKKCLCDFAEEMIEEIELNLEYMKMDDDDEKDSLYESEYWESLDIF